MEVLPLQRIVPSWIPFCIGFRRLNIEFLEQYPFFSLRCVLAFVGFPPSCVGGSFAIRVWQWSFLPCLPPLFTCAIFPWDAEVPSSTLFHLLLQSSPWLIFHLLLSIKFCYFSCWGMSTSWLDLLRIHPVAFICLSSLFCSYRFWHVWPLDRSTDFSFYLYPKIRNIN